ncbi:hypothetical protein HOF65_01605 [bacterium]|jgi:hypothetical protein|nr:hypothetical protein [bacterium]MBT5492798.1 hypothetical protein [bacterium]MBT6778847.1 hypothetical protein [bacterium]
MSVNIPTVGKNFLFLNKGQNIFLYITQLEPWDYLLLIKKQNDEQKALSPSGEGFLL